MLIRTSALNRNFEVRREYLQKIYSRLSDEDVPQYLRTEQLVSHGLDAKVVPVKEDIIQFEPSFFKPQDKDISTRFPMDLENSSFEPYELHDPPPNWDEELKFAYTCIRENKPGDLSPAEIEKKAFLSAKSNYDLHMTLWKEDQANPGYWHHGSGKVSSYMRQLKWAPRKNIPASSLREYRLFEDGSKQSAMVIDLTPLSSPRIDLGLVEYPHSLEDTHPTKCRWFIKEGAEDNRKFPVPHAILTFEGKFNASRHQHCITSFELLAILRFLLNRCYPPATLWQRDCSRYVTQPILLISYVGRKHGRITQAYYDEAGLHIQYTKLMSFEENAKLPPPVDLFLRYSVSLPVCVERDIV